MTVLLITDSFPPEVRSAAELMRELARELVVRGHRVVVVTSWPRHNSDSTTGFDGLKSVMDEDGVRVIRARSPAHHNVGRVRRGLAELALRRVLWRAIREHVSPPIDSVLVYSPPLPLALIGARVSRTYSAQFVLNVQDLFPQNAIDLGILRSRLLIRFFSAMERRAYRSAQAIVVHSPGNRDVLERNKYLPREKVHVIPNWIDVERFLSCRGTYRTLFGLNNRFVVLFAGVIGPSQGLHLVIEAANLLRHKPKLLFLLVGDGTERRNLQAEVESRGLKNVMFRPFISADQYPELVSSADAGLVCLSADNQTPVVPAKILGYMAGGLPVIAAVQANSDAHLLIKQSGCGLSVVSDKPANLVRVVEEVMADSNRAEMGGNGQRYAQEHLSTRVCVDRLESLLGETTNC